MGAPQMVRPLPPAGLASRLKVEDAHDPLGKPHGGLRHRHRGLCRHARHRHADPGDPLFDGGPAGSRSTVHTQYAAKRLERLSQDMGSATDNRTPTPIDLTARRGPAGSARRSPPIMTFLSLQNGIPRSEPGFSASSHGRAPPGRQCDGCFIRCELDAETLEWSNRSVSRNEGPAHVLFFSRSSPLSAASSSRQGSTASPPWASTCGASE